VTVMDGDADWYIGQAEKEAQKIVQTGRSSYQPQQMSLYLFLTQEGLMAANFGDDGDTHSSESLCVTPPLPPPIPVFVHQNMLNLSQIEHKKLRMLVAKLKKKSKNTKSRNRTNSKNLSPRLVYPLLCRGVLKQANCTIAFWCQRQSRGRSY